MEVQKENGKNCIESYFAPCCRIEVQSRENGEVKYKMYVGYSCPLNFASSEKTFESFIKEKGYRKDTHKSI